MRKIMWSLVWIQMMTFVVVKSQRLFWRLGIFEALIRNHGGDNVRTTCATNKKRKPIDSIWTYPGLTFFKCGFLRFHEVYRFNSDHQLIWVEICNEDLHGHCPQPIYRAPVSNVTSNDPDIREKNIQKCLEKYELEDDINDYQTLESFCEQTSERNNMQDEIIHLHKSLAEKIHKIKMEVDKSLAQIFQ